MTPALNPIYLSKRFKRIFIISSLGKNTLLIPFLKLEFARIVIELKLT